MESTKSPSSNLSFEPVPVSLLPRVVSLEKAGYPSDEAATEEKLKYRITKAPQFFLGAYDSNKNPKLLVGFITGTCIKGDSLTHDSMDSHDLDGTLLCIHSVVMSKPYQRKGNGLAMLKKYVSLFPSSSHGATVKGHPKNIQKITLIAKKHLIEFYKSGGFTLVGPSPVVHGKDLWYELSRDLVNSKLC